jgi:hypothetical protein
VNQPRTLRLALDQNFPTPLINAVRAYLPSNLGLQSLHEIDPRLSDLDDRPLIIGLHQLGWDGLITNNYKMLEGPTEIAAIVTTKIIIIAIEGLGHDPLRGRRRVATGASRTSGPPQAGHIQRVPPRLPASTA